MLTNIASGIKEGLIAYQTKQKADRDQRLFDVQMEEYDPDSPTSLKVNELASKVTGLPIPRGTSAHETKTMLPLIDAKQRADAMQYQSERENRLAGEFIPGGDRAKAAWQVLQAAYPEKAKGLIDQGNGPDKMSAQDVKGLLDRYDKQAALGSKEKIAQEGYGNKIDIQKLKNQGKQGTPGGFASEKEFDKYVGMLTSARGDASAQQAMKDMYSAKKALGITGLFKNPNDMSNQDVSLLTQEVAKMATGGVPTHAEMAALANPTISTKMAPFISALTNSPTPANAGAFVQHYIDYVKELHEAARSTLEERSGALLSAKNWSPDQLKRFGSLMGRYSKDKSLTGNPNQPPGERQPDANDLKAINWLKANPNDPNAAGVINKLKAKGIKF